MVGRRTLPPFLSPPVKRLIPPPIRLWAKERLRRSGYDVVPSLRPRLFEQYGVTLLLDVGASEGLYGDEMQRLGYAGRIASFEPRTDAFERLRQCSAADPLWDAHPFALGDEDTTSVIHLSGAGAGDSSSLLGMLDSHTEAAPGTEYVGKETVQVRRLDGLQGFKQQVLDGADGVLGRVTGLQLESPSRRSTTARRSSRRCSANSKREGSPSLPWSPA